MGADPRNTNHLFEQMYRASMFYGRKGCPSRSSPSSICAIWDLLGKIRGEPVYKLIGGNTKDRLDFYCTGPSPPAAKEMGFWGPRFPCRTAPKRATPASGRTSSSSASTARAWGRTSLSWSTATCP